MNILSNNCAGAFYYQKTKCEFNNPFMWTLLFADDMIRLVNRIESNRIESNRIHWASVSATFMSPTTAQTNKYIEYNNDPLIPGLTINDVATVYFPHYRYDANAVTPIHHTINVFYRRNYEYAASKYFSRLKKWMTVQDDLCYLIVAYERHGWTPSLINKLVALKLSHKMVLVTTESVKVNNPKICSITDLTINNSQLFDPHYVIDKYYTTITDYFT